MTEYQPYPSGEDTEAFEFQGTKWYLTVPATGFSERIVEGDIVHIPPESHSALADLLTPLVDRTPTPATDADDGAADAEDDDSDTTDATDTSETSDSVNTDSGGADSDDNPLGSDGESGDAEAAPDADAEIEDEYNVPAAEDLDGYTFNQLRSAAGGTPVEDKQDADKIRAGLNQLRDGGPDAVDDEYLRDAYRDSAA